MCVTAVWHWEWAWLSHACQYLFFPGNKANAWEHHACITAGLHQWDPVKAVFIFSVTMLFHSDVNYTASIIWGWTFNLCQGQDATEKVKRQDAVEERELCWCTESTLVAFSSAGDPWRKHHIQMSTMMTTYTRRLIGPVASVDLTERWVLHCSACLETWL